MNIAVLVSGGVDSSVALRLLQDQGHTVTAFYLKIWLEDELSFLGDCPWEQDLAYVRQVCEQADVPLHVISLQKEYWDIVVSYVIAEVKAGRTPNPDILCNSRIKFGAFLDKIGDEFDAIASGHYAAIKEISGKKLLYAAPDAIKDQTYFLSHLNSAQLNKVLFPLGNFNKAEVRELAQKYDLPNKERKDSQGICFLGKLKYDEFLKYHLGTQTGDIIEYETNTKIGEHNGFWFYTIGQRSGLGLSGGPWYVTAKDPEKNYVYISRDYYAQDKKRDSFTVANINWLGQKPTKNELSVKLRHGPQKHTCVITYNDDTTVSVQLSERDQGIASGQFAVFYDGEHCLGGGVIS